MYLWYNINCTKEEVKKKALMEQNVLQGNYTTSEEYVSLLGRKWFHHMSSKCDLFVIVGLLRTKWDVKIRSVHYLLE